MTTADARRQIINTEATQAIYDRVHFAQANRVGDTVWLSGQTGMDALMNPVDGMTAQARLAFEGVKATLAAAGASMADIVEITSYHTDLRGEMREFMKVKDEFIAAPYPAWTAVGVTQLAIDGLLVELRVVAVAGSGPI